jgi:uncharacterized protein
MWKFIVTYLLIYSGVHGVFYHRARVLLPEKGLAAPLMVVFLLLMILSPVLTHVLENKGQDFPARCFAYAGYVWMGFLFLAFTGCLVLYLLDFLSWSIRTFSPLSFPVFKGVLPALLLLIGCALGMGYGCFEAANLRVEHLVIKTNKLPSHVRSLRIVQISDVHLGVINRDTALNRIMETVEAQTPDILVCTGDLVDGSMHNLIHLADRIKNFTPPLGKFAITGNHEYYAGLDHAIEFMEKSGFDVLRHEVRTVAGAINIAGIDDGGRARIVDDGDTLDNIENGLFTLYLKHRPTVSEKTLGLFDLQLSGHTHNGQLWPFKFLVSLEFPMIKGLYQLEKGSRLYVGRGTGTWGPPARIFSPPEITLIELIRQ